MFVMTRKPVSMNVSNTSKGIKVKIERILKDPKVNNVDPRRDIVKKSYHQEKHEHEEWIERLDEIFKSEPARVIMGKMGKGRG
jgi:hypothetical protein